MDGTDRPDRVWLHSPAWDAFWMLPGLWFVPLLLLWEEMPHVLHLTWIVAVILLWVAHLVATTYTAFCMPVYRSLVREQRYRFLAWPALASLGTFSFLFAPATWVPFSLTTKIIVLATVVFFVQHGHAALQHYGVLSIYRIRAGQSPFSRFKRYEKAFAWTVGTGFIAVGQFWRGADFVRDTFIYSVTDQFVQQGLLTQSLPIVQAVALPTITLLTLILLVGELKNGCPSLPKILYAIGMAVMSALAFSMHPFAFFILWSVQHWMVSIGLAGHMAGNNGRGFLVSSSAWYRFWARFNSRPAATVAVLFLIGVLVAPFFQYPTHPELFPSLLFSSIVPALQHAGVIHFLVAAMYSVVFSHVIMDRAVFRFSDGATRRVTAPLIFGGRAEARRAPRAHAPRTLRMARILAASLRPPAARP